MSYTAASRDVSTGPMDLLLHLIKKNDMDIMDIPIAAITQEYCAYLDVLKTMNLDNAGEFLVMASKLFCRLKHICSCPQQELDTDEGPDPSPIRC